MGLMLRVRIRFYGAKLKARKRNHLEVDFTYRLHSRTKEPRQYRPSNKTIRTNDINSILIIDSDVAGRPLTA